jgi:hypothetical protein
MTRIEIATRLASGLLASQDAEKGWNINRVCEVALRTADKLIEMEAQPLPEPQNDTGTDS